MNETQSQLIEDLQWLAPPSAEGSSFPWTGVGLAAVAVLTVTLILLIRWRKKKNLPFIKPPLPHEIALRALRKLETRLTEGQGKAFALQASLVIRVYIQERFGLRAPHRSTEEFLWEASQSHTLTQKQQTLLAGFLTACDLVKFAGQQANLATQKELLKAARKFVFGTAPSEETTEGAP